MSTLIAMDCDGTMEGRGGPIPYPLLHQVAAEPGVKVVRIGDAACAPAMGFPEGPEKENGTPESGLAYGKSRYLRELKEKYPGYDEYIVVDDQPSQYTHGWVGWEYLYPRQFVERYE